jgi:hypothetical protein
MVTWMLVLVGASVSPGAAPGRAPAPEKSFQIEWRFKIGDALSNPTTGTAEVVSRPMMILLEKQEGQTMTGQTVTLGGEPTDVGYSLRARAESAGGGKIRVRVAAEWGEVLELGDASARVRIERAACTRVVRPGEAFNLKLGERSNGKETWVELMVWEATP